MFHVSLPGFILLFKNVIHSHPTSWKNKSRNKKNSHHEKIAVRQFAFGREALAWVLLQLCRESNRCTEKKIICPALFCASTSGYLEAMGFSIVWCDLSSDLSYNLAQLKEKLEKNEILAVIVCDFFGYRSKEFEDTIKLCNGFDTWIVNDCCHAFSPIRPFDPRVHATVVSLRKMFPTPFGGAAYFFPENDGHLETLDKVFPLQIKKLGFLKLFSALTITWWRNLFFSQKLLNPYPSLDKLRHIFSSYPDREKTLSNKFKHQTHTQLQIEYRPSLLISVWPYLVNSTEKRNSNARYLLTRLDSIGIRPIFSSVQDLDAPQVLPILINSAPKFVEFLRENGVGAFQWPAKDLPIEIGLSASNFETSKTIANDIVCLPVHQNLRITDLDQIFGLAELWQEQNY